MKTENLIKMHKELTNDLKLHEQIVDAEMDKLRDKLHTERVKAGEKAKAVFNFVSAVVIKLYALRNAAVTKVHSFYDFFSKRIETKLDKSRKDLRNLQDYLNEISK